MNKALRTKLKKVRHDLDFKAPPAKNIRIAVQHVSNKAYRDAFRKAAKPTTSVLRGGSVSKARKEQATALRKIRSTASGRAGLRGKIQSARNILKTKGTTAKLPKLSQL